jgi:hypothetical protein
VSSCETPLTILSASAVRVDMRSLDLTIAHEPAGQPLNQHLPANMVTL